MKPPTKKAGRAFALLAGAAALTGPAGCFTLGEGLDPPLQQLYYPTAVVTSPGQRALYIVNSDFDIQYTGGTVQALDLESLRKCTRRLARDLAAGDSAETACANVRLSINADSVLVPGPCGPIPVDDLFACVLEDDPDTDEVEGAVAGPLIKSSRIIGAFASSATLARNPAPAPDQTSARLFVAVRGDPSITIFDTENDAADPNADPFRLECAADAGARTVGGRCGDAARAGLSPYDSARLLRLPVEPVGVAVSDLGKAAVSVHQTVATASLLSNDWAALGGSGAEVSLEYTMSGLPDGPADVVAVPTSGYAALRAEDETFDYRPGFLVTYLAAPQVDMVRFYDDSDGTSRHFLQRVASFPIATNTDGSDSRGIAILDDDRRACEAACDAADAECLRACVDVPLEVFVANRAPASLLHGHLETRLIEQDGVITGITDSLKLNDMVPLSAGPSRVAVGHVLDADGRSVPRVFAVSFDSRYVAVYDPELRRIETAIRTGRGPHALAFDIAEPTATDPGHAFLYVAHFTDSYIGVVDLDASHPRTYGSMFAAVGTPTPPKESN